MSKPIDLTNQVFGRLLALEPTEERVNGYIVWKCQCECGNIIKVPTNSLTTGNTTSCGYDCGAYIRHFCPISVVCGDIIRLCDRLLVNFGCIVSTKLCFLCTIYGLK